ncbi:MAG: recombinase family protein [Kiritimatiellae bacterium]|nr:recombinase family protein [Kiritimatiellia bacterium]
MIYFYARVSTKEQNLARQLNDAEQFGVDRVFSDKQSGKNFDRAGYEEMISTLQSGDLVVVSSLDRLGRDYAEIGKQWERITKELGADIKVLDMELLDTRNRNDLTGTLISDIVLKLLAYVAETERRKILSRQAEGVAAMPIVDGKRVSARTGRGFGRESIPTPDFEKFLKKQKDGQMTVAECCEALGISRKTWYRRVEQYGAA